MRYEIFSDGSASLLKLNSMGVSGDVNVTKFGPARRDLYIIHYVTKGKGYYNGNEVNEGEGFLIYQVKMRYTILQKAIRGSFYGLYHQTKP